uniref:Uncharacterized protein n=1 Tax=Athene cunicularia TaxID=194338 RepID=A0A663M5N2_ATHCN
MEREASQLERDHIHSVYEKIASYFSDTRYKAWPKVQQFISQQEPGSLIADIGCGNGKYLHISSQVYKGCDYCHECFNAVLSIAAKFCLLPVPTDQTFKESKPFRQALQSLLGWGFFVINRRLWVA